MPIPSQETQDQDPNSYAMTFDLSELENDLMSQNLDEDEEEEPSGYSKRNKGDGYFDVEDYKKLLSEFHVPNADADADDDFADNMFEKKKKSMTDITPPYGLVYKQLLKPGTGPPIPEGALVVYHYSMYQEKGVETDIDLFDSTYSRNKPDRQRLGNALVEGLEIAILSMKKGERSRFIMDYRVMYGERGVPPRIDEKSDILAEVEIISFMERSKISNYFELTEEERAELPFKTIMDVAHELIQDGKGQFQTRRFSSAFRKYAEAVRIINTAPARTKEEEDKRLRDFAAALINAAQSAFNMERMRETIKYCNDALDILDRLPADNNGPALKHKKAKAFYYRAKAQRGSGNYDAAKASLTAAYKLEPQSTDIKEEMVLNDTSMKQYRQKEKDMYRQMFKASPMSAENNEKKNIDLTCPFARQFESDMLEFLDLPDKDYSKLEKSYFSEDELKIAKEVVRKLGLLFVDFGADFQIKKKM